MHISCYTGSTDMLALSTDGVQLMAPSTGTIGTLASHVLMNNKKKNNLKVAVADRGVTGEGTTVRSSKLT